MPTSNGGTQIYCSNCRQFTVCRAVNPNAIVSDAEQRWSSSDCSDIAWFRRARVCRECSYEFLTAEVDEGFVYELIKLRHEYAALESMAADCLNKLSMAFEPLQRFTTSLKCARQRDGVECHRITYALNHKIVAVIEDRAPFRDVG
jgi:hypothetical protein